MPILDPSMQYFLLLNQTNQTNYKDGFPFIFKYLQIASRNKYCKYTTIEASKIFKNDLQASVSLVNEEFECNFNVEKDFQNSIIKDYYKYFYKNIKYPNKMQASKTSIGSYFICNDKFETKFYSPYTLLFQYHSWYLSDTPIAVLCLDSSKFSDLEENSKQKIFQLIKLEIDLMEAAGLTLVLCYEGDKCTDSFLYQIIKDNQFSELHINIFDKKFLNEFLTKMKFNYFDKNDLFKGFIYLYSCFFETNSYEWQQMKYFRQIPRTKVISFSVSPEKALKKLEFIKTDPFPYCKTGFDHNLLRVCLCYVPLYERESEKETTIDFTDFCIGFISSDDFLFENGPRTNIYIENNNFKTRTYKAINFNDIHFVRPDLFVTDTLYLMSIEEKKHEDINQIKDEVDAEFKDKKFDEFKKEWNPERIKSIKDIKNIICAYTYITRMNFNKDFSIRRTQIYAVLQSYSSLINNNDNLTNNKGVVYQINTGEGKSCIISLISAILSKSNKIVHVVSSNIKLSNRDYLDSYDFFKLLNIESTVLLHKSELPYYTNNSSIKVENEYLQAKNEGKYPDTFFSDDKFENSARMNFITCGLKNNNNYKMPKRKRVIFSTLVNFECFYLNLVENCPGFIEQYFDECVLLIDEADSILIDEITNGTIISREMKSNAKEVLSQVYDAYHDKKSINEVLNDIKKIPLCKEITKDDIEQMYKEIKTIEGPEFTDGKKYSVEKFTVKNKKRIINMCKKTVNYVSNIPDKFKSLFFNDDDDDGDDEEEDQLDTNKVKIFKHIIPFDYDHKGILEPNKEFSGFIPQFIALKEKKNHPELIFKDISISYLYISHPIYANLYKCICGFTGTIGKDDDKYLFLNQYKLESQKIHRHQPNLRVDFPITVCDDIKARNKKISEEVLYFHKKGNPVLIIFQDFNEIIDAVIAIQNEFIQSHEDKYHDKMKDIKEKDHMEIINKQRKKSNKYKKLIPLKSPNAHIDKIHNKESQQQMEYTYRTHKEMKDKNIQINIFDGKDDFVKPDLIAGVKGAITLGSNICGRGTDIKCLPEYPLHVIVSFYSKNNRVMQQAFGRTARKGQGGSCHVICVKNQVNENRIKSQDKIDRVIKEIEYKTIKQREFVNEYKSRLPWLFGLVKSEKFSSLKECKDIKYLRKTRINVNRIVAYKYKFPICLSYETFIKIQAQKILSLFNCPNCVYTMRLIQRYIREMVLESWTLMEKKVDQIYDMDKSLNFNKLLDTEIEKLNKLLDVYLPQTKTNIITLFVHICKTVIDQYEDKILQCKKLDKLNFEHEKNGLFTFTIFKSTYVNFGLKPYSLLSESGARILYTNLSDMNYIHDPELKYERKLPNNKFSIVSITERIDDVLNKLFQAINQILGQKTFLKFFVRRTIAGCEFGACFDLLFVNDKSEIKDDPFILVDKNPLIVFTVFAWSMAPLLISILVILLIYLLKISKKIIGYISCPATIVKDVVSYAKDKAKEFLKDLSEKIHPDFYDEISSKINSILSEILQKQLKKIEQYDKDSIFLRLTDLLDFSDDNDYLEKISNGLTKLMDFVSVSPFLKGILKGLKISPNILKTGLLLILCISTFLCNFKHSFSIEKMQSDASELDSSLNINSSDKEVQIQNKLDEYEMRNSSDIKIEEIDNVEVTDADKIMQMTQESEYYIFMKERNNQPSPFELPLSDIVVSEDQPNDALYLPTKKVYLRINHKPDKEFFALLSSKKATPPVFFHPSAKPFVGFVVNGDDLSFFLYNVIKINEVLVFDRINLTVFAYGLAVAMEYLHRKDIIYNLNLNNVFVFDDCNPFIFESQPNLSCESGIDFMPPSSQGNGIDSKKKDNVYSYGKILYYIVNKNIDEFDNSLFSLKRKPWSYNQNSSNTNNKSYSKWSANNWSTSQNSSNTNDKFYSKWSANNWANAGYNNFNSLNKGYGWSTPEIYKKNLRSIYFNSIIHNCIDEDPNRRPPFSFICDVIEEHHLNYNEDPFIKNYIINLKKFRKPALYKK